eukprot:2201911-Amphidinium_carterae.2
MVAHFHGHHAPNLTSLQSLTTRFKVFEYEAKRQTSVNLEFSQDNHVLGRLGRKSRQKAVNDMYAAVGIGLPRILPYAQRALLPSCTNHSA